MSRQEINGNRFGLVAGDGNLPVWVAQNAFKEGYEVCAVCYDKNNFSAIKPNAHNAIHIGPGEVGKGIQFLIDNGIKQVIMIGKVSKTMLFNNPMIDARAFKVLKRLKRMNDDAIMLGVIEELESEGINVLNQTIFIKDFFAKKGIIVGPEPTENQLEDIQYGFELAKAMGKLDIGQTVVVQDKMILAVEAIEGTDLAIKRGCKLGSGKAVIVKVSKPSQDQRFDIPVVGEKTLKNMKKYGGKLLALEAEQTLIVNEEKFASCAKALGIQVIVV